MFCIAILRVLYHVSEQRCCALRRSSDHKPMDMRWCFHPSATERGYGRDVAARDLLEQGDEQWCGGALSARFSP